MIGTMFCIYETPCGICTLCDKPCTERKCKSKPKLSEPSLSDLVREIEKRKNNAERN